MFQKQESILSENKKTATLLITCPDQLGLVAGLSNFLLRYSANILHADQHIDGEEGLFLMRVEWDLANFTVSREHFSEIFQPFAAQYQMKWQLVYSEDETRVAIFVSKTDHCLVDILHRYRNQELNCQIPIIVSNHSEVKKIAEFFEIPLFVISNGSQDKLTRERQQLELLKKHQIKLIVLARYMQILSPEFVDQYPNQIINIHHSFLPAFIGAKPYHQAFERGVKLIGATSHYVTKDLDEGPIIAQDVARITHRDSIDDLLRKGRDLEKLVLSRTLRWHLENRILNYGKKTVVFE
ncbi:MAG: formyltetrahydrofolate deformylase [Bdellovibrionia bacterium]